MTLYEKQQELMEFILNNGKELPSAFIASRQYIIKELGKTEGWSYGKVMTQLDVLHEKGKLYNLPHDLTQTCLENGYQYRQRSILS
jgi:hypothetical protein